MAKKRVSDPKRKRKSSATSLKRTLEAAITSNPFLNFFLSKCRVKGNAKLHKFAKRAGDQWKDMSYQEKTPYYLLADKARTTPVRKKSRKRRYSESDIGEGSFSMITVIKNPDSTKRNKDDNADKEQQDKTEIEGQNPEGSVEGSSKPPENSTAVGNVQNSAKNDDTASKKQIHDLKPYKRKRSGSSSASTSFHSMDSDDSVERDSKRRGRKSRSWTDSFDYMS